jgi:replicative DNA helicase
MLTKALALRLLAMRASVPVCDIRTGHFTKGEYDGIRAGAVRQAEEGHTLYLLDEVVDVHAITAHARRAARQHHVGMVVVDYLGLCTIAQKFDRNDLRVGEMARLFKVLAQATRMAVVVLVQLSRRPATEKRAPVLSDLRDSGNIEEHADVVLFLYPSGDTDEVANTQIIVAKQRQGQTGSAQVGYRRATMQYVAHADAQQEVPF